MFSSGNLLILALWERELEVVSRGIRKNLSACALRIVLKKVNSDELWMHV